MKVRNNEDGQVLVITALSMTLLLAFLGALGSGSGSGTFTMVE